MNRAVSLKSILFVIIFLNIIFMTAEMVNAQLDPTFGTNGVVTANTSVNDKPLATFVLPDAKVLIVSSNECCTSPNKVFFIKFNSDGTPDASYGTNGIIEVPIPFNANTGEIFSAARQTDGKIVLVGREFSQRAFIARYNEDATLDTSFAGGGIHRPDISVNGREELYSVVILPDGKILVAGGASFGGHNPSLSFLRYLPNGSLDTTFDNDGFISHITIRYPSPYTGGAEFLYVQSNGKIIVGSLREGIDTGSNSRGSIRRFNADGTFDDSFPVLFYNDSEELKTLAVQPDDKILVGTRINKNETLERTNVDSLITRFNADGGIDANFGTGGQSSFDITSYQEDKPVAIQVMPDGQILVAVRTYILPNRSNYRSYMLALARLSPSGAVNGKFLTSYVGSGDKGFISVLPDGKILTVFRGTHVMLFRATGVPLQTYKLRGIPFDFPGWIGVGSKPIFYRPGNGSWNFYFSNSYTFGLSDDIPVAADYLGNFSPEFAVFRPSNGTWYIAKRYDNAATNFLTIQWGLAGDIPVPADYDGDGKYDVAVFRPSDGTWYIHYIADGSYTIQRWGLNVDKPAPGDYDGDSIYDIAVYRPSDGNWYIQRSSDGGYTIVHFGVEGDIPVQEDYDGDGKTDIAVYRPSNGVWYRLNSSDGGFRAYAWGLTSDIPVPGDYNGDNKTEIAVWRPSNGGWYIYYPEINQMTQYNWGAEGDLIPQAKY
jgi:uncharacterized delta-60 repeat protein